MDGRQSYQVINRQLTIENQNLRAKLTDYKSKNLILFKKLVEEKEKNHKIEQFKIGLAKKAKAAMHQIKNILSNMESYCSTELSSMLVENRVQSVGTVTPLENDKKVEKTSIFVQNANSSDSQPTVTEPEIITDEMDVKMDVEPCDSYQNLQTIHEERTSMMTEQNCDNSHMPINNFEETTLNNSIMKAVCSTPKTVQNQPTRQLRVSLTTLKPQIIESWLYRHQLVDCEPPANIEEDQSSHVTIRKKPGRAKRNDSIQSFQPIDNHSCVYSVTGRPKRKAAASNLSEPKLNTKMRQ